MPFTMGGSLALENAFDLVFMAEINNIEGSIVECGVARGGTAASMAMANKLFGKKSRNKWLFDSYEGLPAPTKDDYVKGSTGSFIRPLPKGSCLGTIEQVSELMFGKLKFSENDTFLIKGWFQDTLYKYRDRVGKISVLRLDGDWYESTKIPLDVFYRKVSKNGFVIIDDYFTCHGSKKAVDEFLRLNKIMVNLIPDRRGGVWFQKKDYN